MFFFFFFGIISTKFHKNSNSYNKKYRLTIFDTYFPTFVSKTYKDLVLHILSLNTANQQIINLNQNETLEI